MSGARRVARPPGWLGGVIATGTVAVALGLGGRRRPGPYRLRSAAGRQPGRADGAADGRGTELHREPVSAGAASAAAHHLLWAATLPPLVSGDAATLLANYRVVRQSPAAGSTLSLGIGATTPDSGSFLLTHLMLTGACPAG